MTYHYVDFSNVRQWLPAYLGRLSPKEDRVFVYFASNLNLISNQYWVELIKTVQETKVPVKLEMCLSERESTDKFIIAKLTYDASINRTRKYRVFSNNADNDPIYTWIQSIIGVDVIRVTSMSITDKPYKEANT